MEAVEEVVVVDTSCQALEVVAEWTTWPAVEEVEEEVVGEDS